MSKKRLRFISFGCLIALSANSVTIFAQGAVAVQPKQEPAKRVWIATPDGKSDTMEFVIADGQQATFSPAQGSFEVVSTGPGGSFGFVGGEMSFDLQLVKGVPFSAVAINETTQTLGDGNRIVRRTSTNLYRDSEGRTRREQALVSVGPFTSGDNSAQRVYINDPVNGTSYVLDPRAQTAQKNSMPQIRMRSTANVAAGAAGGVATAGTIAVAGSPIGAPAGGSLKVSGGVLQTQALKKHHPEYPPVAKAAGAEGSVQIQVTVNEAGQVTAAEAVSGHPLLRQAAIDAAKQWQFKPTELSGKAVKVQGTLTFNFVLDKGANTANLPEKTASAPSTFSFERMHSVAGERIEFKRESLGKQMIEGIEAEGTRTVSTIPAGSPLGNERAIEIVSERWFSAELQTVVLSRHNDPRTGESVYRLENINRTEPPVNLFQVPAEYTLISEPTSVLRRKMEQKQ